MQFAKTTWIFIRTYKFTVLHIIARIGTIRNLYQFDLPCIAILWRGSYNGRVWVSLMCERVKGLHFLIFPYQKPWIVSICSRNLYNVTIIIEYNKLYYGTVSIVLLILNKILIVP